jgi:hypothetical protein
MKINKKKKTDLWQIILMSFSKLAVDRPREFVQKNLKQNYCFKKSVMEPNATGAWTQKKHWLIT